MIRGGPIESSVRASPAFAELIIGLAGGRLSRLPDGLLNPYTEPAGKWYRSEAAAPTIAPMTPAISSFMARLSAMASPPGLFFESVCYAGVCVSARSGEVAALREAADWSLSPLTISAFRLAFAGTIERERVGASPDEAKTKSGNTSQNLIGRPRIG